MGTYSKGHFKIIPSERGIISGTLALQADIHALLDGPEMKYSGDYTGVPDEKMIVMRWRGMGQYDQDFHFDGEIEAGWQEKYLCPTIMVHFGESIGSVSYKFWFYRDGVWYGGSENNNYAAPYIVGARAEDDTDLINCWHWVQYHAPGDPDFWTGNDWSDITFGISSDSAEDVRIKHVYLVFGNIVMMGRELTPAIYKSEWITVPEGQTWQSEYWGMPAGGVALPFLIRGPTFEPNTNLGVIVEGRMYNEDAEIWMSGGRYTNGGAYATDELIDNPVHIIESIYRDELGFTNADIDLASFDAAAEVRKDWLAAGSITKVENSRNIIIDIAQEFGIRIIHNQEGKIVVRVLDWYDSTQVDNAIIVKQFHENDINPNSVKLWMTPLNEIYDRYEIKYAYSPIHNEFRMEEFADKAKDSHEGENLVTPCLYAYNNYLNEEIRTFKKSLKWARWHTTSTRCLNRYVRLRTKRRLHIEFKTTIGAAPLEAGDVISFQHSAIPNSLEQYQKWEVTKVLINLSEYTTTIRAVLISEG